MPDLSKRYFWLAVLLIWIAGFAVYSNSYSIAFQFDDTHTVQMNLYVRSLSYIPQYFVDANTFSYRPENSGYRPMTTTALALGFWLSQLNTWGYHFIKLVEHCLVATLIMVVGLRLLPRSGAAVALGAHARLFIAFFAGLIFVVHRANTETVDYISAISTLQAGLFLLLGFYLYLRFTEVPEGKRRWPWLALSSLSYLASMLSKEEGITLIAMIFFYEWIMRRQKNETYWVRLRENWAMWAKILAPYLAMALLFVVCRMTFQPAIADVSRGSTPTFIYFITQFRSWLHYWALFFWPVTLNADNLAFDFSSGLDDWRMWAALAGNVVIWTMAWRYGRIRRFVLFAVVWLYVTVSPAASIFPLVEAVNEHRMYAPYMLLSLLAVWGVFELASRYGVKGQRVAIGALSVLALALGVGAHARNEVWQTDLSLWEDVYEKNPQSPRAMNVLGVSLLGSGQVERSVKLLERCHALVPQYLPCMVHLGMGYAQQKRYDEGLKILQYANSLDPNYPHVNFHLGLYYKDYFGDFVSARRHFQNAINATNGRFFPATIKLAEIEVEEDHLEEAARITNDLLKLDATNGDAAEVQAKAMLLLGRFDDARKIFERLVGYAPGEVRFALDMANLAERSGQLAAARDIFAQITTRMPPVIQAWQGVARLSEKLGDREMARVAATKIAELKSTGQWTFLPSMILVGEKKAQVRP